MKTYLKFSKKFYYVFSVSIIFASLIIIVTSFIDTYLNRNKQTQTVEILNPIITKNLDLCSNYKQKQQKKQTPENEIQKIIGYKNNKFGLYIYSVNGYARIASEMVNSNGGDWGYVLVPYNIKDYEINKWNSFFKVLNEEHLIPIIQLWDNPSDFNEMKKRISTAGDFLNSLNWPIKNRYISVFNEPNDDKFWEGGANADFYAKTLEYTIDTFKKKNKNFFIMPAGFNASALGGKGYIEFTDFINQMEKSVPGIFNKIDGWASHPYPHVNGYLGKPTDTGRNSIKSYDFELSVISKYTKKELPIFITETGWPNAEGVEYNNSYYTIETVSKYLQQAFNDVWLKDDRVVAVTPFTIYYNAPFDHFSFIDKNEKPNLKFYALKEMKKIAGVPPVVEKINLLDRFCENLGK